MAGVLGRLRMQELGTHADSDLGFVHLVLITCDQFLSGYSHCHFVAVAVTIAIAIARRIVLVVSPIVTELVAAIVILAVVLAIVVLAVPVAFNRAREQRLPGGPPRFGALGRCSSCKHLILGGRAECQTILLGMTSLLVVLESAILLTMFVLVCSPRSAFLSPRL